MERENHGKSITQFPSHTHWKIMAAVWFPLWFPSPIGGPSLPQVMFSAGKGVLRLMTFRATGGLEGTFPVPNASFVVVQKGKIWEMGQSLN